MKKLYIGFILLFGLLAFVPQVALGDVKIPDNMRPPYGTREHTNKRLKYILEEKDIFMCLYKKKLKLSQTYNGHNLQLLSYDTNKKLGRTTGIVYYRIYDDLVTIHRVRSIAYGDCQEIITYKDKDNEYKYYDLSNVPAGSYLRFIPETKEMEVWLPRDNSDSKFIENKIEKINKIMKEKQGLFKGDNFGLIESELNKLEAILIQELPVKFSSKMSINQIMEHFIDPKKETNANDIPYDELKYSVKIPEQEKEEQKTEQQQEQRPELKYSEYVDENSELNSQNQLDYNDDTIPDFVIRGMLIALLLTLVIEGLLAAPFGWKFVGLVSLANIITNPALNGIIWHYQITETSTILWLEAAVVLIEWGIFSVFIRKNYGKLLLFAFVANLVSYLTGVFFPL